MEDFQLNQNYQYSLEGSINSRTRTVSYTLVGISKDNRDVTRRILTTIEHCQIARLIGCIKNEK